MSDIALIIVLYYPSEQEVNRICNISHYNICILVDNTPGSENELIKSKIQEGGGSIEYIPLKENRGIAAAQNVGIAAAREKNIEYVLFLDQDSQITVDFPGKLLDDYKKIVSFGLKIGAIGPLLINQRTGDYYKIKFYPSSIPEYELVSIIVSSGMLTSIENLNDIGEMDERLFIDYVDFEWCWRAQAKGYMIYMSKNVVMQHKIGIGNGRIFDHRIILSRCFRYYYQYRNILWLCSLYYVPLSWKVEKIFTRIGFILYAPFLFKHPWSIWRNMFRGIRDGIKSMENFKKKTKKITCDY